MTHSNQAGDTTNMNQNAQDYTQENTPENAQKSTQLNPTEDATHELYHWTPTTLSKATRSLNSVWFQRSSVASMPSPNNRPSDRDDECLVNNKATNNVQFTATRIITDTRTLQAGDIFLAIAGENFDGHDFLQIAVDKGAVALIVSQPDSDITTAQLVVSDTRVALGQLAAYRRQQHGDIRIIALTGSSGKTTVKEMLRSIFERVAPTLITRGNLNNDLGVPMMLLEMQASHRYAVLELGANHVGEIAYTTDIVKPDVACVLNIGTAHLGEFGGRDNIAKTKAEIFGSLTSHGVAVIPCDDDYAQTLYKSAAGYTDSIISFSRLQSEQKGKNTQKNKSPEQIISAHLFATNIASSASQNEFTLQLETTDNLNSKTDATEHIVLPLAGRHNIDNALAAAACATALGIGLTDIAEGLRQAKSTKGRLQWQDFGAHRIIDDTYNANPNSVLAAADVLADQTDIKILVLGDIGELGDAAISEHTKLGDAIATRPLDALLCVGDYASYTVKAAKQSGFTSAYAFSDKSDLVKQLKALIADSEADNQTCTILIKGSRSMTMETVIASLKNV